MKKFFMVLIALAAALIAAPAVKADSFTFAASGVGFSGSGTLTGTALGGGTTAITSGAFTINGVSATIIGNWTNSGYNVYTAGAGYNYDYDDLVIGSSGSRSLDTYGLLFKLSNGGVVNIWEVNGTYYWNEWIGGAWEFNPGVGEGGDPILNGSITPTPEPSSLLLLGTGLLLMACFVFWKSKQKTDEPPMAKAA